MRKQFGNETKTIPVSKDNFRREATIQPIDKPLSLEESSLFPRNEAWVEVSKDKVDRLADQFDNLRLITNKKTGEKHRQSFGLKKTDIVRGRVRIAIDLAIVLLIVM